jgi:hypothetical protein
MAVIQKAQFDNYSIPFFVILKKPTKNWLKPFKTGLSRCSS